MGSPSATIAAIAGASIEEAIERGFLVEFDSALRRWRGKPELQGEELRLQQLVWMCDANQSAIAELNAIVISSFAQVLLQQHAVILALGYVADAPLDIAVIFVQLMVELTLEVAVDCVAMWAETEHGIPVTHYLTLVQSGGKVFIFQSATAVMTLCLTLFSFLRHPHIFSCDSSYVCDCVKQPQYVEWLADDCSFNSTANFTAAQDDDDSNDMFHNVDPLAVIVAVVTGFAMLALIWLAVLFARYRKRNAKVVSAEAEVADAKASSSFATGSFAPPPRRSGNCRTSSRAPRRTRTKRSFSAPGAPRPRRKRHIGCSRPRRPPRRRERVS